MSCIVHCGCGVYILLLFCFWVFVVAIAIIMIQIQQPFRSQTQTKQKAAGNCNYQLTRQQRQAASRPISRHAAQPQPARTTPLVLGFCVAVAVWFLGGTSFSPDISNLPI
jgi:hypothetical protein